MRCSDCPPRSITRRCPGSPIPIRNWRKSARPNRRLADNDRAQAERATEGLIKVIARPNGRILGASILGAHAGELIHLWGLAISQGLKLKHVAGMIAPYPALGEIGKSAASEFYKPKLFSPWTRRVVGLLNRLP